MATQQAEIIAAHGRHYLATAEVDGQKLRLHCVTRGKKSDIAVGDLVEIALTSKDQAVIEKIVTRKTLLYRSDQYKSKMLAANLTRLLIVVATEPGFTDDLVSRALVAAESAGITPWLVLNKVDLADALPRARERMQMYRDIGYPVLEVSAQGNPEATRAALLEIIQGESTILIGQSGMGKSSLINLLVPDADIATREISAALDTGKHTTTFTRLYDLPEGGKVIDSPGFADFAGWSAKQPGKHKTLLKIPQMRTLAQGYGGRRRKVRACKNAGCGFLHHVSVRKPLRTTGTAQSIQKKWFDKKEMSVNI